MARFKTVDGRVFPLTTEEENKRDVEEAAWEAGRVDRDKQAQDTSNFKADLITTTNKATVLDDLKTVIIKLIEKM